MVAEAKAQVSLGVSLGPVHTHRPPPVVSDPNQSFRPSSTDFFCTGTQRYGTEVIKTRVILVPAWLFSFLHSDIISLLWERVGLIIGLAHHVGGVVSFWC